MTICKEGYLNDFVKPTTEGGWGLCEWIVSIMTENRGYTTTEIYETIQNSELDASIKALTKQQISDICEWMIGKEFSGVTIGKSEEQEITYVQVEGE